MKSICNFGYARSKRGSGQFPNVRGLLKYLQYRDDRNDHIPDAGGSDRWVDGGLGANYQTILSRLDQLSPANPNAYCFAVVVSPDPEAIAQVEGDPVARFVQAVEASLAAWEDWREEHDRRPQLGPIEYAMVVHRPERAYGTQMHAHIIMAAATEDALTRERTPLYNNRPEIEAFKDTVYRELDRAYGLDRDRECREVPEQVLASRAQPEVSSAIPPAPSPMESPPMRSVPSWPDREIPFHERPILSARPGESSPMDTEEDDE